MVSGLLGDFARPVGDVLPFHRPTAGRSGSYDRALEMQTFVKQLMGMGMSPEGIRLMLQNGAGRPGMPPWGSK
jgi:hypothetical protein